MSFKKFNLQPWLIDSLKNEKLIYPTLIQDKIIPLALKKQNLIVKSPTGTGKTHIYLIKILNNLNFNLKKIQGVIILPTRELAQQTYNFLKVLIKNQNINVICLIGGKDIIRQSNNLNNNKPQIIIGTLTRIKLLYEIKALKITTTNILVIDECDMLFDMGFIKDLFFLISKMKKNIQIMTFSATISPQLFIWMKKNITNANIIDIKNKNQKIKHIFININNQDIKEPLKLLLKTFNPYLCLIFVNKKELIENITDILIKENKNVAILHGGLPSRERIQTFKRIRKFYYQYVVCSDIMARGIDIEGVSHVISLKLPINNLEYYFHRMGRTGRYKYSGISYVFYNKKDDYYINKLKKQNILIEYYKIKNNDLVPEKKPKKNIDYKIKIKNFKNKEEQYIINKFKKTKKVTPCYKKKFIKKLKKIEKTKKRKLKLETKIFKKGLKKCKIKN